MRFKLHHKTPLPIVLGLVVNLVFILLIEVLAFYRMPIPMQREDFAGIGSKYENCTLVTKSEKGYVNFYLVETVEGQRDLIALQSHSLFPSRGKAKIISAEKLTEDGSAQRMTFGLRIYDVSIRNDIIQLAAVGGVSGSQAALSKYMLLALVLTLVELGIWEKLKGE